MSQNKPQKKKTIDDLKPTPPQWPTEDIRPQLTEAQQQRRDQLILDARRKTITDQSRRSSKAITDLTSLRITIELLITRLEALPEEVKTEAGMIDHVIWHLKQSDQNLLYCQEILQISATEPDFSEIEEEDQGQEE
jgi:hypothetical protein